MYEGVPREFRIPESVFVTTRKLLVAPEPYEGFDTSSMSISHSYYIRRNFKNEQAIE